LNPSAVRFGSSEIYNILLTPEFEASILDSLVVGQQRSSPLYSDATERVLLFLKCWQNTTCRGILPTEKLTAQIRRRITKDLTRIHVPAYIFEIAEIPHNANGKKMEIQVKAVVNSGTAARTKQRVSPQELKLLGQFEPFYHLEALLRKLEGKMSKL